MMEEIMIGMPSLKSMRFSLMFEYVALAMLTAFTKSPVGRAKGKGMPNQVNAGISTREEPTPPKAKIKLRTNEQTVINMRVVICTPSYDLRCPYHTMDSACYALTTCTADLV